MLQRSKYPLSNIISYAKRNNKGRAFAEYTEKDIERELTYCEENNGLFIIEVNKKISGIGSFLFDSAKNEIEVLNLVSDSRDFLGIFCFYLMQKYPGAFTRYKHHGIERFFSPERNIQLMKKLYGRANSYRLSK